MKQVVVVDKDTGLLLDMERFISSMGCEVATAREGRSLQRILQQVKPDILFLGDSWLYDEQAVLHELISRHCSALLPIVLMASAAERDKNRFRGTASSVIYKPVDYKRVRNLVLNLSLQLV